MPLFLFISNALQVHGWELDSIYETTLGRVDGFLPKLRSSFVFSVSVWFPDGATIFQPYFSCPPPLSEPGLRNSRTRLPVRPLTAKID